MVKMLIVLVSIAGGKDGGASTSIHEMSFKTLTSCEKAQSVIENSEIPPVREGVNSFDFGDSVIKTYCLEE